MSLIPSGELKVMTCVIHSGATLLVSMSLIPSGELKAEEVAFADAILVSSGINESNSLRGVESFV